MLIIYVKDDIFFYGNEKCFFLIGNLLREIKYILREFCFEFLIIL